MKAKGIIPYEIMVFTDIDAIKEYFNKSEVYVLMSADNRVISYAREKNVKKILQLLEEPDMVGDNQDIHMVFKYQSAENIIKEALAYCVEGYRQENAVLTAPLRTGVIVGIYSPVGRCRKTTFALALSDALAKNKRVMYLNLEEFSGLSDSLLMAENGTLSDVMYMYRRSSSGLKNFIGDITRNLGEFSYIPPAEYLDDVADVLPEEWITFCRYLIDNIGYDYLVIDMGSVVKKPWSLLDIMDVIFMPEAREYLSQKKIKEFEESIRNMGCGQVLERIETIRIPDDTGFCKDEVSMEKIRWSSVGNYARKVVNERNL